MRPFTAVLVLWSVLAAVPAAGQTLYGADGGGGRAANLYALDPASGTPVSEGRRIGFGVTGLAVHPVTGVLYGSTSRLSNAAGSLITIDKATGAGTLVGPLNLPAAGNNPTPDTLADLTFTSDGTLYGWAAQRGGLFSVNLSTGAATPIGPPPLFEDQLAGGGLAADGSDTLFVSPLGATGQLFTVNRQTGQVAPGATLTGSENESISAMTFSPSGVLYAARVFTADPIAPSQLVTISRETGQLTVIGESVHFLDAIAFDPSGTTPPSTVALVASVLPGSRSVQVGTTATAFATIIATGTGVAMDCTITPVRVPVGTPFVYQETDAATNQPIGSPNTPVTIPAGASRSFVIAITPRDPLETDLQLSFDCANTNPAPFVTGVNTLELTSSPGPVPDIVALAATPTNNGIVDIPGPSGTGFFVVATSNVGSTDTIDVTADVGVAQVQVGLALCQTNPVTSVCRDPPGPLVTTQINAGATPTFAIFVQGGGMVPFNPAVNRVFVRFRDANGVSRGSTSVAIRTQ